MSDPAARQQRIFEDLLKNEGVYVQQLGTVMEQFVIPLKEGNFLRDEDYALCFGNLESLIAVNRALFNAMLPIANDYNIDKFVAGLKVITQQFSIYAAYLEKYNEAKVKLQAVATTRKVKRFLARVEGQLARREGSRVKTLLGFMSVPVQRVVRYDCLLDELLTTFEEGTDYHREVLAASRQIKECKSHL